MSARGLVKGLLESVFPPVCGACEAVGREPFCRLCAEALEEAGPLSVAGADLAVARWVYGGPVALAIQALKYAGRWTLARPLGRSMLGAVDDLAQSEVVVPVPSAPDVLVARGFNQARELARGVGLPVWARALVRRPGPAQVGLDRAGRLENLTKAFGLGEEAAAVEGRRVLLVDDVITTGATAEAAVGVLRAAGAIEVRVVAVAAAAPPGPA